MLNLPWSSQHGFCRGWPLSNTLAENQLNLAAITVASFLRAVRKWMLCQSSRTESSTQKYCNSGKSSLHQIVHWRFEITAEKPEVVNIALIFPKLCMKATQSH